MHVSNLRLKHLNRFRHIVNVLVKYGFGEILDRIRIWESINIEKRLLKHNPKTIELGTAHRIRQVIEELGPTFIKLGQLFSTRPDIIPSDLLTELKKLQTSVVFIPTKEIRCIVESEFGRPVDEIFSYFDEKPLAAASLAQVHRAIYKDTQVVLKVQRPNIVEITDIDINIMRNLADLFERYSPTLSQINTVGMVEEFAEQIRKELDFRREASNMREFAQNFSKDRTIRVPKVYSELSSKRVVTMEYLDGINISDIDSLSDGSYDFQLIARRGAIIGFKATFQHGFFHADPHPGNIIVLPNNVIGVVDFGMMATLSARDRERLARLVFFTSIRDEKRSARALNEIMGSETAIPAEELEPSLASIIQEYSDVASHELKLANMLFAMMRAIIKQGGKLRPQLIWVAKSIAVQENIIASLNTDFNIMDLSRSEAQKVLAIKLHPFQQKFEVYYWLIDTLDLLKDLPYDIGVIVRNFRKGKLKIEFEHMGLEPILRTMDRVANRTSLTIVFSSLLISSSLLVLANIPPYVGNIPLLGFIGFIITFLIGALLVLSIKGRR